MFPNIVDDLYKWFDKEDKHEPREGISFSPSSLNDCRRKTFYRLTEEEVSNPIDLPARFKMHFGTIQHRGLQDIFEKMGFTIESEVKKEIDFQGLKFRYLIDEIAEINGEKYIIEIKTTYSTGMEYAKERPKDDHLMQTLAYMQFEKIPKAIILYVGRDNGYMAQHNLEWNSHLYLNGQVEDEVVVKFKEQIGRMHDVKSCIELKKIPERDYQIRIKVIENGIKEDFTKDKVKYKSDWQCSYCQWRDKCWTKIYQEVGNHSYYINGQFIDKE